MAEAAAILNQTSARNSSDKKGTKTNVGGPEINLMLAQELRSAVEDSKSVIRNNALGSEEAVSFWYRRLLVLREDQKSQDRSVRKHNNGEFERQAWIAGSVSALRDCCGLTKALKRIEKEKAGQAQTVENQLQNSLLVTFADFQSASQ